MQLLSSHGIPVSLPSELPSAVEAALETLDERHEAIEVGLRLVDLSKESSVSKSDAEAMRACAEQICMLCLIAYEEALESGDLEERLEEARHLGVSG